MIILILLALVVLIFYSVLIFRPKNFPPGPPCLPVVGSMPFVPSQNVQFTMQKKWLKEYGPVVGLMYGSHPAIAVTGAEAALEVLRRDEFQGRPDRFNARDRAFNKRLGFFFTDGPFWVEQRRFSLRHLRDFGFGKKSLEGIILEEVEELIKGLQYNDVQRNGFFGLPAINILWSVLGGLRLSQSDGEFMTLLQKITRLFRTGNPSGDILDVFPFLRFIFPGLAGYRERKSGTEHGHKFLREAIREHMRTLDENEPRDFIDVYVKEMKKNDGINNVTYTEDGLVMILLDLFSAGAESVANSLDYSLLYMILHPHIQRKVQEELDAVVGSSRKPSLDDRSRLPYLEATLTEALRINPIAPLTPHHRVMTDTNLNGYDIPKISSDMEIEEGTMIILISLALAVFILHWVLIFRPKNFPPGPPCLPVVGSMPFVPSQNVQFTMQKEWLKEYGPVVGLMYGSHPAIAVIGAEATLEVLRRDEFQGRPDSFSTRDRAINKRLGFFFTDGPFWAEQRRFSLRHLRDLGFGKKSLEGIILEEAEELIKGLQYNDVQRNGFFDLPAINILWSVVAGARHTHNDGEFMALMQKISTLFRTGNPSGDILDVLPFLRFIFPGIAGFREKRSGHEFGHKFFRETIREHMRTFDENQPRDFIDVYLKEMKNNDGINNVTYTEDGLVMILLDLFIAGAESVPNSLDYALLYMILHPHIQRKVQEELDAVVGRSRRPSLDDRSRLPYLEATLTEALRINPISPLTPHHRVMTDTKLNGYDIPKDTSVIISLWSVLNDPDHWGDPEVFRPERFLDSNGKFVKDEWMINFGSGKRYCIGESLARNILFLFFATFLQEFSISSPEGDPRPKTTPQPGFTTAPYPFRIKLKQRM